MDPTEEFPLQHQCTFDAYARWEFLDPEKNDPSQVAKTWGFLFASSETCFQTSSSQVANNAKKSPGLRLPGSTIHPWSLDQLFEQTPWFWLDAGMKYYPLISILFLLCCLCSYEGGSEDWMLKTNLSLVTKPQNTSKYSIVNLTSVLYIAK